MTFLKIISIGAILVFVNSASAGDTEIKEDGFMGYFLTMCMKNVMNLEDLRVKINKKNVPKLPAENAKFFLNGKSGDAWPLPENGKIGNLIMALPNNINICTVHARRIDKNQTERQFELLVSKAPQPLTATLKDNDERDTATNGKTRTISYTWSIPNANKKLLFMLTTTSFEHANLQGMASASIIKD